MLKYVYNLNSVQYEHKLFASDRIVNTLLLCKKNPNLSPMYRHNSHLVRMESTGRKA
jgi:hypothetical protein